ncbi:alpha/beta fold hydrolase [Kineococcus sp. SYSU DK003]|uniref:alpha/beta fold hydrolase n=1 Tax=Kineococcus sp. SYSU DK003 TaxID=3383124 RepID=UPI003D7DF58A
MSEPTVVLVHGAFAESSSWNGVIGALGDRVEVLAVANPLRSVAGDAAYLHSVLDGLEGPFVLVGHSYGGMVITEAAGGRSDVTALVYVASFAPENGESALDLSGKFPGSTLGGTLLEYPVNTGGTEVRIRPEEFHAQFAADVPADVAALMARTQRPVTTAALGDALSSTSPAWRSVPSWFVYGSEDRNVPAQALQFMADRAQPRAVDVVDGASHAVAVSNPARVAAAVIAAAGV